MEKRVSAFSDLFAEFGEVGKDSHQAVEVVVESHDEEVVSVLECNGVRFVKVLRFFREDLQTVC